MQRKEKQKRDEHSVFKACDPLEELRLIILKKLKMANFKDEREINGGLHFPEVKILSVFYLHCNVAFTFK